MRRLKLLKILMPAALVVFAVLLYRAIQFPSGVHTDRAAAGAKITELAEGVNFNILEGTLARIQGRANRVEQSDDGSYDLSGIDELRYVREDGNPILISAAEGEIEGEEGQRTLTFVPEVEFVDPEEGLTLRVPRLVVDEAAGEARALDRVFLEGASLSGSARQAIYGLRDQPTRLEDLSMKDGEGGTLRADLALLLDGLDDVVLEGGAQVARGVEFLEAQKIRVTRGPTKKLQTAEAEGGASGRFSPSDGPPAEFSGDRLDAQFDLDGTARRVELVGGVVLKRQDQSLQSDRIEAWRDGREWTVNADGGAFLQGVFNGAPARLRAESVSALLNRELGLLAARATGRANFESSDARAEADTATYDSARGGRIRLFGTARAKARLARERTRIAAEEIDTDPSGSRLTAIGRVESTLLQSEGGAVEATSGIFRADEAIHFVSDRLESRAGGQYLVLSGTVRGWQGERNLSADTISIDQQRGTLAARENVTARFPRATSLSGASEAHYIQITSAELDYDRGAAVAVFSETVRVRLVEGWVEADRIEIALTGEGGEIEQIEAEGSVRLEFRQEVDEGVPNLVTGDCDRLVYVPAEETLKLIGEDSPASVRRIGQEEGTTTGRVLRYHIIQGTLEVDSGDQGAATIRTGK